VPGCEIEVRVGSALVGKGTASRQGATCVGINLANVQPGATQLRARMVVCSASGPDAVSPVVSESDLPKPTVGAPLYGCQRLVPLSGLHHGAMARLETDTGTHLGTICSCWTGIKVRVGSELVAGQRVRARLYWDIPCKK